MEAVMSGSHFSRRKFFKKSAVGIAGSGMVISDISKTSDAPEILIPKYPNPEDYKVKKYRPLGKLGFKASDISIGTTGVTDPACIAFALECGINYIDTAYIYGRGKSEKDIGTALKGKRDGLWINTKFNDPVFRSDNIEQGLLDSIDESLKRMKIDHIDSIMIHDGKPEEFLKDELHSAFGKAKKAGKVKYLGVSSHANNAADIFKQVVNDKRFDIILVVYGIFSDQSTEQIFKKAYDDGKAVIAMKTLGAAYNAKVNGWDKLKSSYSQLVYTPEFMKSAFAWVLKNPYVSIMVKRMNSIDDVKNCLAASGTEYSSIHGKVLEQYGQLIEGNYCKIGCGDCLKACPNNVAINDIMRFKMYFENYKSEKEGIVCYNDLNPELRANACLDCNDICAGACTNGLDIKTEMIRAHDLLTV